MARKQPEPVRKRRRKKKKLTTVQALTRFLIGIVILLLLFIAGYILLFQVDYSANLVNQDGTYKSTRAYVVAPEATDMPVTDVTPEPQKPGLKPTAEPTPAPTEATATDVPLIDIATKVPVTPTPDPVLDIIDVQATSTPSIYDAVKVTPKPNGSATPSPTKVPYVTATPAPQVYIESNSINRSRTNLELPSTYTGSDFRGAITSCYVSKLNEYKAMQIIGWGYVESVNFNGAHCSTYLVLTNQSTKKYRIYECDNVTGISGVTHEPEKAVNTENADFRCNIDTSDFKDGVYSVRIILKYGSFVHTINFDGDPTIIVVDGEIIQGVAIP